VLLKAVVGQGYRVPLAWYPTIYRLMVTKGYVSPLDAQIVFQEAEILNSFQAYNQGFSMHEIRKDSVADTPLSAATIMLLYSADGWGDVITSYRPLYTNINILVTLVMEALLPPKRRLLQKPHSITSQKTPFFNLPRFLFRITRVLDFVHRHEF
jgi:hypothetical protein